MNMFLALFLHLSNAVSAQPSESVRIEVDEASDRFRVVVYSDKRIRFDARQLEAPFSNFPPASAGVLVRQKSGEVVGCHKDNQPNYPVELSSSSSASSDKKMVSIGRNRPYATPWYESQTLFYFFDQCIDRRVNPNVSGDYAWYQIVVEIETSAGVMSSKTGWLNFHDFDTSGWGDKKR